MDHISVRLTKQQQKKVILGTSLGFLYVLDHMGNVKPGWPVTMAEIQGQIAVGDVNDDGQLELVATDNRFNVAVFNWKGKEVWEKRISGFSAQGPILGDINGDGAQACRVSEFSRIFQEACQWTCCIYVTKCPQRFV